MFVISGYNRPDSETQVTIYRNTRCCWDYFSLTELSEGKLLLQFELLMKNGAYVGYSVQ